jgi:hypothetical protein
MSMSNSDIEQYLKRLELHTKNIKDEIFRISWYMRGGVSSEDLFHVYSAEDRQIMGELIKENIETTKNSRMAII